MARGLRRAGGVAHAVFTGVVALTVFAGVATLVVLTVLVAVSGSAAAHPGHGHQAGAAAWLPAVLFLLGVGVLGASLYADEADAVPDRLSDLGVALGLLGVLAGVASVFI